MIFEEEFYHEPTRTPRTFTSRLVVVLRTVGRLKAPLLYYKQRHLFVLRYATLYIYTATPCVYLAGSWLKKSPTHRPHQSTANERRHRDRYQRKSFPKL